MHMVLKMERMQSWRYGDISIVQLTADINIWYVWKWKIYVDEYVVKVDI